MAKTAPSFFFLFILVGTCALVNGQRTWCVARPSSDAATLQANIDYACSQVDCSSVLRQDRPCFNPNNLINHASIAMNLYYKSNGRNDWNCHFSGSGMIVIDNPSYGGCIYE